ncbi:hypothetical protein EI427_17760 [Flammeovirga pectinis]|uniref:Endonuclease/exonuclease/phosphatase domain-containing protein n=1 Tax=Flammeovirga pectinis TaxID=2494373 RepID=A0A3S9P778_9BACT|nr:endonuclease/exonuclease/phosphatase family protein [Flammeovirga pectinis]AZQ64004.1 hypothetical protein EI427_17760 [Flammeovirga pectinis]
MSNKQLYIVVLLIFSFLINACNTSVELPGLTEDLVIDDTFTACLLGDESQDFLEVVTWNVEHFPKHAETLSFVAGTIINSSYDLWGVQEVEEVNDLKKITKIDPRYSVIVDSDVAKGINEDYHLAYVYRNDHLEIIDQKILSSGEFDGYYFPRRPLWVKFKNKINNEEFVVINLHLKCCGGSQNNMRRTEAGLILKRFLDKEHSLDKVIVLGDYNTVIAPYTDSDMQHFLIDNQNYKFSDQLLADSNEPHQWSYPNWPSHIDHILMTNELFSQFKEAITLPLDNCSGYYDAKVSDHRPVLSIFRN